MSSMSPSSWAQKDLQRQRDHFESTGKPAKFDPPPMSAFVSEVEWKHAFDLQLKYCTKPHHLGDRAMPRSHLTKLNE